MMVLNFEPVEKALFIRKYDSTGTLDYTWTITVVEREPGYWEPIGWMRPPNAKVDYFVDGMEQIERYLRETDPGFVAITGTFAKDKLRLQERMWRRYYRLIPIREIHKEFNGCMLDAVYVKFERVSI